MSVDEKLILVYFGHPSDKEFRVVDHVADNDNPTANYFLNNYEFVYSNPETWSS